MNNIVASSSMVSSKKYDVFVSFRGEDTRKNFTSHLYEALKQKNIETYIDYRLEKGDKISTTLFKAIEDSHVSIVVFSKDYASSKWCLAELSKILECKKEKGQIVIPIFYNIDPSDVRKQTGSYQQSFAKYNGEPNCNKWKDALTEVANLAAWDSQTCRSESEFLKDIVEDVWKKLGSRYLNHYKGLVGIEENYENIESLLKIGSNEGTEVVEGIILDLSKLTEDLYLSSDFLAKMTNMRFLKFHNWSKFTIFNLYFCNGLDSFPFKLRYLHLDGFSLKSLPSNFCTEQLVELCMHCSNLKKLWDGIQNLVNLKKIDLWGSRNLIEIPDLSKAEKLESVSLCYCESLCQLQVPSKFLGILNLYGCSSLKEFSVMSEELTTLNLAFTNICALPSSIWNKRKLRSLNLTGCYNLEKLSEEPRINDFDTLSITKLASNIDRLVMNIKNIQMMTMIWLDDCWKLVSLPELPTSLEKLSACNCISMDTDITQRQVLEHMLLSRIPYIIKHNLNCYDEEYFFPGDHVINECRFHTEETSITIPYLLKSELQGFIYCIVLSKGPLLKYEVLCSVYQDCIRVGWLERLLEYESLISDHVLILYHDINEFDIRSEEQDHFLSNITFIFEDNEDVLREFGVFPIYGSESGLKTVGNKEIF
ncbi:hypothetical protein VNO78_12430 [Psophocarpus tetragonolobus]|uniref:TIR domain-containing protein n=1 Tax=Psophocarpus tetragonolobus TaxID=3891 RepID=A0AAN9SQR6_PSOTE